MSVYEVPSRDLNVVPLDQLQSLAEQIDFFPSEVILSLQQSIGFIEMLIAEQTAQPEVPIIIPQAIHGLVSFLQYCLKNGEDGRELSYILLPPIDPRTLPAEQNPQGRNILDDWRVEHLDDNKNFLNIVWPEIVAAIQEGRGLIIPLLGAMYSAKSGFIFELLEKLESNDPEVQALGIRPFANEQGPANVSFYTAAALGEHHIKSRLHDREIPVDPLTLEGLVDIANGEEVPRMLVVDEITFVQFPLKAQFTSPEDPTNRFCQLDIHSRAKLLMQALETLKSRGVIVIATGLDSDFRGFEFEAVSEMHASNECYHNDEIHPLSFYAMRNGGGRVKVTKNGHRTTRFLHHGLVDIGLFPVPVSKELGIVDYFAVPSSGHYWDQLSQIDPEVYNILKNNFPLGPDEQALNVYIAQLPPPVEA